MGIRIIINLIFCKFVRHCLTNWKDINKLIEDNIFLRILSFRFIQNFVQHFEHLVVF